MKEMTLNPLPALTWNWLRMNKAACSEEAEYNVKPATLETSGLPAGATFISGAASQAQEAAAALPALQFVADAEIRGRKEKVRVFTVA